MNKQYQTGTKLAWDTLLSVDGDHASGPLYVRLTNVLRDLIRSGRIPTGSALPPSRQLADDLGCSRWVVTEAYEQLVAEGYLEARVGSGTRVLEQTGQNPQSSPTRAPAREKLAFDLRPGLGDLKSFPRLGWMKALRQAIAEMRHRDFGYPVTGGHPRLRKVLTEYLRRVRGARASKALGHWP